MEILSEQTEWGFHIFFMSISVIFAVLFTVGLVAVAIESIKKGSIAEDSAGILVLTLISALTIAVAVVGFREGPEIVYKAIVTDYNEVYDAGYTVVKTEGKIVTLTKE